MSDALAISGDYADLKLVKTRSVMQIVVECPIEEGERIVRMFGVPQPGKPVKLAIARITDPPARRGTSAGGDLNGEKEPPQASPAGAGKPRKSFDELPASQQAAMLCNEPRFQTFLAENYWFEWDGAAGTPAEEAASKVRTIFNIASRADLDKNPAANARWQRLRSEYQAWLSL